MSAVSYDLKFAAETIWKVGLAGILLGAGLPVLFAVGVKALAWGTAGGSTSTHTRPNPLGKVIAAVILLVVLYAIAAGIVYIIATGKGSDYDITFEHLIPEITQKAS